MLFAFGPRYARSTAVTPHGDRMRKCVAPSRITTEAHMTRGARAVGRRSGLFAVPRVLACDAAGGTMDLERIGGLLTLGQWLAKAPADLDVIRRVGAALGCVHSSLLVPRHLRHRARVLPAAETDLVAIHGDFNSMNVCYQPAADRIVILDWSCASMFGAGSTLGHRHLDLCHMLRSLIVHQANLPRAMRRFNMRAAALLDGYAGTCGAAVDAAAVGDSLLEISDLYRNRPRVFAFWPRHMLYQVQAALAHRTFAAWRRRAVAPALQGCPACGGYVLCGHGAREDAA